MAFLYSAGGAIMGNGNSLAAAVYDGHGGDQISRELERVLLQVRGGCTASVTIRLSQDLTQLNGRVLY